MEPQLSSRMMDPTNLGAVSSQMDWLSRNLIFFLISLTSVFMSTSIFFLFQQSHHPTILTARFPCPAEWSFNEGDWVLISSSGKLGVIESIGTETAEVDLANGEGIISVTWTKLHKHIIIGDFVEVLSGSFWELTGWVDGVDGKIVHVVQNTSLNPLRESWVCLECAKQQTSYETQFTMNFKGKKALSLIQHLLLTVSWE